MPVTSVLKWDSNNVYTDNAEIHTRMFDMGDPHAKKKINKLFVTFTGATNQATITMRVYFRFHNNDTWKFFGSGTAAGKAGRRAEIIPTYNSANSYQMERVNTTDGEVVRIKDVYTIQFKLSFFASNKIEINDYSVEYRTLRTNTVNEPEV